MFTPFAFIKSIAGVPTFTGILDDYPSAAGAWSVARRLSDTYTDNILTVRRASDNTTQNIGYTSNGNLDTGSLNTFCSGTNGFITTLYDQSGNGVNLTQTTSSRQPLIYTASTGIITKGPNSAPSMYFGGLSSANSLNGNYATSSNSYMSVFGVIAPFDTGSLITSNYVAYSQTSTLTTPPGFGIISKAGGDFGDFMWGDGQEAYYVSSSVDLAVVGAIRKSSSIQNAVYYNGTIGGITSSITDVTLGTPVSIGCIFPDSDGYQGTFVYKGWISEIIVWRSDQTSNVSGIDTNIGTYYGV
jgi:hypothetical protein